MILRRHQNNRYLSLGVITAVTVSPESPLFGELLNKKTIILSCFAKKKQDTTVVLVYDETSTLSRHKSSKRRDRVRGHWVK